MSSAEYDDAYRQTPHLFGSEPSRLLMRFADEIPMPRRVLDVGVGQGRNALPLARRGFAVTGIDPSLEAIEATRAAAAGAELTLSLQCTDVFSFGCDTESFEGVLVFGLIQILSREAIAKLFARLRAWLVPGGLLLLTGWQSNDPACQRLRREWKEVAPNSFRRDDGERRTFLLPDEVLSLAEGFTPLFHHEGLGPWHRHGDGELERHFDVELVARLA